MSLHEVRRLALDDVVTAVRLRAAGVALDAVDRQVAAGRWQRPARGVVVLHARPLSLPELGRVAAGLARAPVVLSGAVVLRELELRWVPEAERVLALVDPAVRTPSSGRVVLRRTRDLAELATWSRGGVQLAPVERAVVDAGRSLSLLRDVRGIVLAAVADGWCDVDTLTAALDRTQRNGSALVRRALVDALRGCASPPEAELVDALVGRGEPFLVNPLLHRHGRLIGSPDVWFVRCGIGGEVDSAERHGDALGVESTYDRHERFRSSGVDLVHLSVRRIRQDAGEAAGYLLARAQQGVPPRGLVVTPRGPLLR